ncbi:hypothetical protein BKA67DRAFT_567457 [Truncatella angustata]|uniref:Uncharacterized protein n=1 Tax=Truncatella angustata TaxID=152316 RepID=A0A9P8UID8_9PEZI|nr:uncharacterized protein BKA67DRAFT_567457 [Truncatella angustata]KAH6652752.1 hypothetical protein BKA67DRAFT_567457 [Truncatella angustata]
MAATPRAFFCLWQDDTIREQLFELLHNEDICNVRLASSACCNLVTKRLFLRTHLTFTANTFTKQSRVQALSRIGHHIEHLTFFFPHSDATFLPPLIHPETGREISFLYTPHTSMASVLARPKFANTELGDILTQQYPPLFHAASNVPSFINAMKHLPNMRHMTIKTPGQTPKERYRRDIVDYALISLRISLERAPLKKLMKLSLSSIHPSAFAYLRHVPGFGCTPSAGRRWKQIRKLHISVESWDFYGPSPGLDHLKVIDDYIRNFSECLEKFTFAWLGRKGPCPVSLASDPLFAPPRNTQKLFNEVTSPMSPLPPTPGRKPIRFRKLKTLSIRNATMNAPQVAELVADHQHSVREFDFENVVLINDGSWDEALSPLMDDTSRGDHWSRHSIGSTVGSIAETTSILSAPASIYEEVSSPSAAVAALSEELLSIDLEDPFEGPAEPKQEYLDDYDLPSDLESARQASLYSGKEKTRRLTKRRRRRRHDHDYQEEKNVRRPETPQTPTPRPRHHRYMSEDIISKHSDMESRPHYRRHMSEDTISQRSDTERRPRYRRQMSEETISQRSYLEPQSPPVEPPQPIHYRSRSLLYGEMNSIRSAASSQQLFGEVDSIHSPSSQRLHSPSSQRLHSSSSQRLFGEIDSVHSASSQRLCSEIDSIHSGSTHRLFGEIEPEPGFSHSPTSEADSMDEYFRPITPILESELEISAPILNTQPSMPTLLQATVYDPTGGYCNEISAVQRDLEAEEAQRVLAENPDLRKSALRKGKEAVLNRLRQQFASKKQTKKDLTISPDAMAAMGVRFQERLFGNSGSPVAANFDHRQSMDVPILLSP